MDACAKRPERVILSWHILSWRFRLGTMPHRHSTHVPLIQGNELTAESFARLVREVARLTAIEPRSVRKALLGERVRDSTRLFVARTLRDLEPSTPGPR